MGRKKMYNGENLELLCNNCKKFIGAANFSFHSTYCQRNIHICIVCDEPVPKHSMKEHEENHITVMCGMCKRPMKKSRLSKHQEEYCLKRRVVCEFCKADFSFDEIEEHKDFCGSRTVKCSSCSKYILLRQKKKHMELHAYEEQFFKENSSAGEVHLNTKNEHISRTAKKGAESNKNDISENDKDDSEDETSSEDEIRSGAERNEKKNVSSKVKGIRKLAQNLKQVFIEERMTDAILKVENREFKVHKIILIARSPVFASMFEHDMVEKKDNAVDILDCTAESFEIFLHYLYSGKLNIPSASNVYNVYYAADKYRVDDLKEKCVAFMIKNLSIDTFCDVIALSLRHGESELQKIATTFFCENIKKIIKTVQWQKYMHENSTQANELLIKALNA